MENLKKQERIQPAFKNCDNCIIMCTDNAFAPATAVALQSIFDTVSSDNYYDIIILHSRVSPLMQETICGMERPQNVSVRFYNMEEIVKSISLYTENRESITMETYYRLFAPWLLSEKYNKALYIDGDMIATRDVYEIFGYDIGENLIAGVKDYWGICNCYIPGDTRKEYQNSIGITENEKYIIAATVLFNLPVFRNRFTLEQMIKTCTEREWFQHDQDVINVLCKGSIYHVSADWGYVSDYGNNHYLPQYLLDELEKVTDPVLIHFAGSRKPWLKAYTEGYLKFWKIAEKTPFFGHLINKIHLHEYKAHVLYMLSNNNFKYSFSDVDIRREYNGVVLPEYSKGHTRYNAIKIRDGKLHLEGFVGFFGTDPDEPVEVLFEVNGEMHPATIQSKDNILRKDDNIVTCRGEYFEFDLPLDNRVEEYSIAIICKIKGFTLKKTNLGFGDFAPLTRKYKKSYYCSNGWAVTTDLVELKVFPADKKTEKKLEKAYLSELFSIRNQAERHALVLRPFIRFMRNIIKKPIWMISDRVMKADDNGEVFFKFLRENKKKNVKACFVLSKDSPDYNRLKKLGKVVAPYSAMHRIYHLLADCTISSQTDMVYRNPMRKSRYAYSDILSDVSFIFLQHGVIHNDISGWLSKKRQGCAGFIATAKKERDSLIGGNYHYSEDEIWLTGMPRFDRLEDRREKLITFLPTWRRYLTKKQNVNTGIWELKNDFYNSEYATFYRNLMNNERLKAAALEHGYTIQFKIHPSFLTHEGQFGFDEDVKIVDNNVPYRDIYSKSSLLITDFSSGIYDFIYLRKPIIYCQFDRDDFFKNHMTEKVELDYENEGYGEIVTDVDSTIDTIIEYMKNDCKLKDKYKSRIDAFFTYNDRNNCERIYERIVALKEKS